MGIFTPTVLVVAPNTVEYYGTDTTVTSASDIEVLRNTNYNGGSYATPTTAFYDTDDAGFDATAMWHKIPMTGWRDVSIGIFNSLGVNVTVRVVGNSQVSAGVTNPGPELFVVSGIATATSIGLGAAAGGTGASSNWYSIPALAVPWGNLFVGVTPASDPAGGLTYRMAIMRRS